MPGKGFTATFISNSGNTLRQFNISGWKLVLLRVVLGLVVLLVSASVVIVAYGLLNAGETGRMRQEISQLQDSLARRQAIETRIDVLENRIDYIYGYRKKLENMASLIEQPVDSLQQEQQ
jgi:Tfp pilus assembly protein PilN